MPGNLISAMSDKEFADMVTTSLCEEASHVLEDVSLGITGSRVPLADAQKHSLGIMITAIMRITGLKAIHHGCATGTDETSHGIALTIPGADIYGHPGYGNNKSQPHLMDLRPEEFTLLYPAKPYRERNKDIVTYSRLILACPLYPENDTRSARSGTWQTVRLARRTQKPVILIIPNGGIMHDHSHGRN